MNFPLRASLLLLVAFTLFCQSARGEGSAPALLANGLTSDEQSVKDAARSISEMHLSITDARFIGLCQKKVGRDWTLADVDLRKSWEDTWRSVRLLLYGPDDGTPKSSLSLAMYNTWLRAMQISFIEHEKVINKSPLHRKCWTYMTGHNAKAFDQSALIIVGTPICAGEVSAVANSYYLSHLGRVR